MKPARLAPLRSSSSAAAAAVHRLAEPAQREVPRSDPRALSAPGEALARAYSTPVEQLAAQLGCTKLEAAQIGIRAAAELLPYIEGKAPISVDVRRRNDVVLIMPGAGTSDGRARGDPRGVDDAEEIDWSTATAGDVLELTSFPSGQQSDVRSEPSE
jgi:hypothetical protein